jgi:hypothetical protein
MKFLIVLLVLWLPFSLAALAAVPLSLWRVLTRDALRGRVMLYAMDRLAAAVCGWSGAFTISAEVHNPRNRIQQHLKDFLNWLDPGHTEQAARKEGLPT